MNVLTFSEARASLKTVMDKVCEDHDPTVITLSLIHILTLPTILLV